jgi:hypothetical protein
MSQNQHLFCSAFTHKFVIVFVTEMTGFPLGLYQGVIPFVAQNGQIP